MTVKNIPFGSDKVRTDLQQAGITTATVKSGAIAETDAEVKRKLTAKTAAAGERTKKKEALIAEKADNKKKREAATAEKKRLIALDALQKKLSKLDKQLAVAVEKAIKTVTHPEIKEMRSVVMNNLVQMPRLGDKHYDCLEYVRPLVKANKNTTDIISMVAKKFDFNRGLAKNYTIMAIERIECGVPAKSIMVQAAKTATSAVTAEFELKRKELQGEVAKLKNAA